MNYTPRHLYGKDKAYAKRKGVPFLLTFEEWLAFWGEDLAKRGPRGLQMLRVNLAYGYEVTNIRKGYARESLKYKNRRQSKEKPLEMGWVEIVLDQLHK